MCDMEGMEVNILFRSTIHTIMTFKIQQDLLVWSDSEGDTLAGTSARRKVHTITFSKFFALRSSTEW